MIFLITSFGASKAFAYSDSFYRAVAGFIYSFPNMVSEKQDSFCAYGYDQVVVAIKEKYGDVIFFENKDKFVSDFPKSHCKVLYISTGDRVDLEIIKLANQAKIVSISVDDDFIIKGGMVMVRAGRRSFELTINNKTAKEFEIKFNPLVESLLVN